MRTVKNSLPAIFFLATIIAAPIGISALRAEDLIDLDQVVPDSGTAVDENGEILPDTGTYVPPKKTDPAAKTSPGGIPAPVEVLATATPIPAKTETAAVADSEKPVSGKVPGAELNAEAEGIWQNGALAGIKAKVRNISNKNATGVRVKATVPGTNPIVLAGPEDIPAGGVATYSQTIPPVRQVVGNIKIFTACDNCP